MVCHEIHFFNFFQIDTNHWFLISKNSNESGNLNPLWAISLILEIDEWLWSIIIFVVEGHMWESSWISKSQNGSHVFLSTFNYSTNECHLFCTKRLRNVFLMKLTSLMASPSISQTSFGPGTDSLIILRVTGVKFLYFFLSYWPPSSYPPRVLYPPWLPPDCLPPNWF